MRRLQDAVLWAAQLHHGQDRDGDSPLPYLTHPLEVLSTLRHKAEVKDEDMLCAAALHDVVEETDASIDHIRSRFGNKVADLVRELTREEPSKEHIEGLSEEELYEMRNALFMDELRTMSEEAQLIKLCDRLCNLREARRTRSPRKAKRYRQQTRKMLEIIPRSVQPKLWDKINRLSQD